MTDTHDGWLSRQGLLAYLDISEKKLRQLLRDGALPQPSDLLGTHLLRWSRAEIDAALAARRASSKIVPGDLAGTIKAIGTPSDFH